MILQNRKTRIIYQKSALGINQRKAQVIKEIMSVLV